MLPSKGGRDGLLGVRALDLVVFCAFVELFVWGRGFLSEADPEGANAPFALEINEVSANSPAEETSSREAAGPGCSFVPLNPVCCAMSAIGRKTIRGRISLSNIRHLTNSCSLRLAFSRSSRTVSGTRNLSGA